MGLPQTSALQDTRAQRDEQARSFRKVTWRILPIMSLGLFLNNMDRTNVGFAALTMNRDLGLTPAQFGWGAGILFFSLCFLEIPSNLALVRFGARRWMARIMISWGLLSAATAFVVGPNSFYIVRFLLGAAEAGFFPGMLVIFGSWFPAHYRTRIYAIFMLAAPISSMVSGPLSAAILPMEGFLGLSGWRWMFLIEGLPVVLIGIILPWIIADSPKQAAWLTPRERNVVSNALESERRDRPIASFGQALRDIRVLLLAAILFGSLLGSYGLAVWMPLILKGHGLTNTQVGLMSTGPFFVGCVTLVVWARVVDRTGWRVGSVAAACLLGAVGFAVSVVAPSLMVAYIGITLALMGITATRGLFWAIPPRILERTAAAGGIAFINTIGTLGSFLGPVTMGWLKGATGSYNTGMIVMAGLIATSGLLSLVLRIIMPRE